MANPLKLTLLIAFSTLIVASGCNQKSEDKANTNQTLQDNKTNSEPTVGRILYFTSDCELTEESLIDKVVNDKTVQVKQTYTEKSKSSSSKKLVSKKDDFNNYSFSGEFSNSGKTTIEGEAKVDSYTTDYSFTGERSSKITQLSENVYELVAKSKRVLKGKNGYKFPLPDGSSSDTKTTESNLIQRYSDDGKTFKVIFQSVNGKVQTEATNYETHTEKLETGKSRTTTVLVTPYSPNDKMKIISSTEDCIEENVVK